MITNRKILLPSVILFLLIECILGYALQVAEGRAVNALMYLSVVLACLFCVLFVDRSRIYFATQIALVCTVCADFFLVWSEEIQQLPAMLFFSVTQLAYFARLYSADDNAKRRAWHLWSRVVVCAVALAVTLVVLGDGADALAIVSMFYYANLLCNVVFAFLSFSQNPLLAIGLVLFALCDTVIGLDLLDAYLPAFRDSAIYKLLHPGFNLAWMFYLPSQALLAISLLPERLKKS